MVSSDDRPLRVTAVTASAQLGGTERVLLDFAARAFEHDIALRVLTPRDGPLVNILNELGVPTRIVPAPTIMLRGSQRVRYLASAPLGLVGLASWARRLRAEPTIADAEVVYAVAFKAYLATATWRGPLVWHLHEFPPTMTGPVWKAIGRHAPNALIANSEGVGRAWRGAHPSTRVSVVPNGVDLDHFRPRPRTYWVHDRLGIPREHLIVGMPAVLARWKGQLEVVEAFRAVRRERLDVHLVFVGGTIYDTVAEREYDAKLRARIEEANDPTEQRVHLLPFQSKIERVYPEFDVTVHYSTRPEAFGRVVLESMACGVPVLAAAEGGPTEIITPACGRLVTPRRPDALGRALVDFLGLPDAKRAAMGAAGRARAEDAFSARGFARGVADVLRHAASV